MLSHDEPCDNITSFAPFCSDMCVCMYLATCEAPFKNATLHGIIIIIIFFYPRYV